MCKSTGLSPFSNSIPEDGRDIKKIKRVTGKILSLVITANLSEKMGFLLLSRIKFPAPKKSNIFSAPRLTCQFLLPWLPISVGQFFGRLLLGPDKLSSAVFSHSGPNTPPPKPDWQKTYPLQLPDALQPQPD